MKMRKLVVVAAVVLASLGAGSLVLPVEGAAKQSMAEWAFGEVASGMLGTLGSAVADPIVKSVMEDLGLDTSGGVLPAIADLERDLSLLNQRITQIEDLITDQNFKNSLRDAVRDASSVTAKGSTFRGHVTSSRFDQPGEISVTTTLEDLMGLAVTLDTAVNDETTGVIPMLMETSHVDGVTDLKDYWIEVDSVRATFAVSFLEIVALLEGYQEEFQKRYDKCLSGAPEQETTTAPTTIETIEYVGTTDTACRANTAGAGGPTDPNAQGNSNRYFDVVWDLRDRNACQEQCTGRPECVGIEFGRDTTTSIQYTGTRDTACRANASGEGGPNDPNAQGNSNRYFDVVWDLRDRNACQQRCTGRSGCTGIEFGRSGNRNRCELWKVPIGHVRSSSYGYGCYRKQEPDNRNRCELWKTPIDYVQPSSYGYACLRKEVTEAPAPIATDSECHQQFARIAEDELQGYRRSIGESVTKMYAWGVPLYENRGGAKFVHARNQVWALGPPAGGTGYFGTVTEQRMLPKLTALRSGFSPSRHPGKTLEQFLEDNLVPTRYVDQSSWACNTVGGVALDGATYEYLTAKVYMVKGNAVDNRVVGFTYGEESRASCNDRLGRFRSAAGRNYQVGSNDALYGGLLVDSYYANVTVGCGDLDLCEPVSGETRGNERFFGRFFTYNLTGNDLRRVCRRFGPTSKECLSATPDRLDHGGRAALRSPAAIRAYLDSR